MFRLYVFPTQASSPSFAFLQSTATTRMNELLRDRRVRLATSLTVQTLRSGTRFWETAQPDSALPRSLDDRDELTRVLTSDSMAEVKVRVTWVKSDIFGQRGRDSHFDDMAAQAFNVGRAWVVEFDESTSDDLTMFLVGAVACAIAESCRGFIVSWARGGPRMITPAEPDEFRCQWLDVDSGDSEQDEWDSYIDELRDRHGSLDIENSPPEEVTFNRPDLAGAIIKQYTQRGPAPDILHDQVREMLRAIDQLEFPIENGWPSLVEMAAALIRGLGTDPDISDNIYLRHCRAINSAVDDLMSRSVQGGF